MEPTFTPGNNIAMKIPSHEYEATVRFYRDVLQFTDITGSEPGDTPRFEFGGKTLWLDCMPGLSQAEIWLEVVASNIEEAARVLKAEDIRRRDDIEPLPDGMQAFWITSPSNIIHLVSEAKAM